MEIGFLTFHQEVITIVLVEHDILIWLQIKNLESCNLSTMTSLVINHITNRLTSPRRLIPTSETKNKSKNSEVRTLKNGTNCRCIIKFIKWDLTN